MEQPQLEAIRTCEWHLKYRMPSGVLISKGKNDRPITIFPNQYLNRRLDYATKMVQLFKSDFDIASIYGKDKAGNDLGEIARYDKVLRRMVLL